MLDTPAAPPASDDLKPEFLAAMRALAHSVTVVATDGPAGRAGATATAMASVSTEGARPTLLVCLNSQSHSARSVLANGVFTVNVLGEDGAAISDVFAGRHLDGVDKFDGLAWTPAASGAPVLADAVIVFDCRVAASHPVGSHQVIIGAVEAVRRIAPGPTLVYGERQYGRFQPFD